MLGRVKNWLGIEGVKLELLLDEQPVQQPNRLEGRIRFKSIRPQTVLAVSIVLIERYSRGRGEERLVDEYQLGAIELTEIIEVPPGEIVERPFSLPFERVQSDVDAFGNRNLVFGGIARLARWSRNVESEYRLEAEAEVKGVALNPFDRKVVKL